MRIVWRGDVQKGWQVVSLRLLTTDGWVKIEKALRARARECNKTLDEATCDALFDEIEHLPDDHACQAVRHVLMSKPDKLPDCPSILRAATDLASPLPDCDVAWIDTINRMRRPKAAPAIHPLVQTCVDSFGGLDVLYSQSVEDMKFFVYVRREFCAAYDRLAANWRSVVTQELRSANRDQAYFPVAVGTRFDVQPAISAVPARKALPPWTAPPDDVWKRIEAMRGTE